MWSNSSTGDGCNADVRNSVRARSGPQAISVMLSPSRVNASAPILEGNEVRAISPWDRISHTRSKWESTAASVVLLGLNAKWWMRPA
jgi:hypothetical protein